MSHQILHGDCLAVLATLPAESVQTCVTSPPYFGLRDYGADGQLGLETSPAEFVAKLVEVFEAVRRVLRDDGTLWLNLGDSYSSGGHGVQSGPHGNIAGRAMHGHNRVRPRDGLKPKDLIGIPWRVAFALQEAGWYLRQDIIWHKPNPMPESVRDRCTKAHEYLFLLSKRPRYYFDAEAIKEPCRTDPKERYLERAKITGRGNQGAAAARGNDRGKSGGFPINGSNRNKRTVWTVTLQPYKGAHFATSPPALITPCILAGSRPGDTVLDPFAGSGTTAATFSASS